MKKNILYLILIFIGMLITANISYAEELNTPYVEKYKLTGKTTNDNYQKTYSELNKQQNDDWNAKYNFKPETNVKTVSTWNEFKNAFQDNNVSKIILNNDIKANSAERLDRQESMELDGQGHELHLNRGTINVDSLPNIESFTKKFSSVPVFHMHDIKPVQDDANDPTQAATRWAYLNGGRGLEGDGVRNTQRGIWQYRIGNLITPTNGDGQRNQKINGRLINANGGHISIWGYNKVISAAENFYTGGITYDPFTYYIGEIAHYNYSTIWFLNSRENYNGSPGEENLTMTENFDIGDNSFVYLHNTGNGESFPGVYEHFNNINVGEYATFNVNVPGTAVAFNHNNSTFLGKKGSKVNLLSRAGSATILMSNTQSTRPTPSTSQMKKVNFTMLEDSELYVYGNNRYGVVAYDRSVPDAVVSLESLEAFDITNTNKNRFVGANGTAASNQNEGHIFKVSNSDISLWKNNTDLNHSPDYDVSEVGLFQVDTKGNFTTTSDELKTVYKIDDFSRISGMNTVPQVEWNPVTDADYTQKAKVFLGDIPIGGSDPFDEYGDAKTKPVYADEIRKAQVKFTDTLGNEHIGVSESDNYVYFRKNDHKVAGFQKAGEIMSATPSRVNGNNGGTYREGVLRKTRVIDVTPPNPAELKSNNIVTNSDRQIKGQNGEPGASVYMSINGKEKQKIATVEADGSWSYQLDSYLELNDKLVFYVEDKSGKAPDSIVEGKVTVPLDPKVPATNNENGNINPDKETSYRDAVFKPALIVTVKDIIPRTPNITKDVESDTPENVSKDKQVTQVGSTLTYTITAQNIEPENSDKVLLNTVIEDEIPMGLTFDLSKVTVTKNDIEQPTDTLTYTEYSEEEKQTKNKQGKLTYSAQDLQPQDTIKLTIKAIVNRDGVGKVINNTASIIGKSPRLENINDDTSNNIEIKNNANVDNPGGTVFGVLSLISAPEKFDFGKVKLTDFNKVQAVDMKSTENTVIPLVVEDTRGIKSNWRVTATLIEEMNYTKPGESTPSDTLTDSLSFTYKNVNNILRLNVPVTVFDSKDDTVKDEYKISENFWQQNNQDNTKQDGLKMKANKVPTANEYKGKLEWTIEDVKTN
ncbi:pectate lyase-like adhesive domain-containing protein [Vagococcus martis]